MPCTAPVCPVRVLSKVPSEFQILTVLSPLAVAIRRLSGLKTALYISASCSCKILKSLLSSCQSLMVPSALAEAIV